MHKTTPLTFPCALARRSEQRGPRGWMSASALALLLALTACASLDPARQLRAGQSTEADVRARFGAPVQVWPETDGGRTLEYSNQPFGRHSLMVRVDAQQRFQGLEDALSPALRSRVQPGMSPGEVSRLLGRERSRVTYAASGEEVWDWTVEPDTPGYGLRFNVHFKDGQVLRTTHSMVFPDRRFGLD